MCSSKRSKPDEQTNDAATLLWYDSMPVQLDIVQLIKSIALGNKTLKTLNVFLCFFHVIALWNGQTAAWGIRPTEPFPREYLCSSIWAVWSNFSLEQGRLSLSVTRPSLKLKVHYRLGQSQTWFGLLVLPYARESYSLHQLLHLWRNSGGSLKKAFFSSD